MDRGALRRRQAPSYVAWRLCKALTEGWEAFDGNLALKGVDPHGWTLRRLLNAAEAYIYSHAEDEAALERVRLELWAEPGAKAGGRRIGATRPARPAPAEAAEDQDQEAAAPPTAGAGPPPEPPRATPPEGGGGMRRSAAMALMAQVAAEDARFSGPRG
ncbi:hypothetical protein [Streptomyces sp. CCM_MD2014]|uniref:hypothetical protein n=1 Tax=Streptomyces sp. CCM_MD2014 TaxID=1561022 RepID=UPI00130E49C7|nr:hypothetical protein [Streptomyces sp. CCM_MD2014]